jgi:hypothetical protein
MDEFGSNKQQFSRRVANIRRTEVGGQDHLPNTVFKTGGIGSEGRSGQLNTHQHRTTQGDASVSIQR